MSENTQSPEQATATMSGAMLAPHIPVVDISSNALIFRDGSLGAGFSCRAPLTGSLADPVRQTIFNEMVNLLRGLPEGATLQFAYGQESRKDDVAPHIGPAKARGNSVCRALTDYSESLIRGFANGRLRNTTLDVYVTIPSVVDGKEISRRVSDLERQQVLDAAPRYGDNPDGLLNKLDRAVFRKVEAAIIGLISPMRGTVILAMEEYRETRTQLARAVDSIEQSLLQAGLQPSILTADALLRRYYRRWNPSKFEGGLSPRRYSDESDVPLPEHFLASPVDWDPSGKRVPRGMLFCDGYYHKVLTMHMPPEMISFPHMESMSMYAGIHRAELIVNLQATSVGARIKALQDEQRAIENNEKGEIAATKLAQIKTEIQQLGNGEERLWHAQHIAIVRGKTPEECENAAMQWIKAGERSQRADFSEEIHALWEYWMAAQPGWSRNRDLHRHNIYNTPQLVGVLPVYGNPGLDLASPVGALYPTNDGGLHNIHLHDQRTMPSPNAIILGASGKGKSVLVNTLMTQLMRHDPRIVMIDIGASYRRLCESVDGAFLEYDIRSSDCRINPFEVFRGRVADPAEIQAVLLLLEKMLVDSPTDELKKEQRVKLEEALKGLIRRFDGKEFFLRDLREMLQESGSSIATGLALRLGDFVRDGTYGNLYDGPSNVPTGARMTVFELAKVKETSPALLPVVFQAVLQHVMSLAANYPDEMKILVMDEAHFLLKDPILQRFVEYCYRTFRKCGIAVVGVSQGIEEWVLKDDPMAILNSVSAVFACGLGPATVDDLVSRFRLSEVDGALVRNLRMVPGQYSQFVSFMDTPHGKRSVVCTNRLVPIQYAMYTSTVDDRAVMDRWRREGLTTSEILERFASKYPNGVKASGGAAAEDRAA